MNYSNLPVLSRYILSRMRADGGVPTAIRLTANRIVVEAHRLCRPVKLVGDELVPVTLPDRVASMYLDMVGEWDLPPLAGICTTPLLTSDGLVRAAEGYDRAASLWCASVPALQVPEQPARAGGPPTSGL
jgi:hypothetical protein